MKNNEIYQLNRYLEGRFLQQKKSQECFKRLKVWLKDNNYSKDEIFRNGTFYFVSGKSEN